ncbi:MAG: hypothetical protein J0M17_14465 [Planctomycetes bacterium]|nr:hypothetical protein [Planctomycetota bacterium]
MPNEPLRPLPGSDKNKPLAPVTPPLRPAALQVLQPKGNPGTIPLAKPTPTKAETAAVVAKEGRLTSLDAFRGFIMLMMASAGFGLTKVVQRLNDGGVAQDGVEYRTVEFFAKQFEHVIWTGGVFWDLIQPAFMFMVGVALPYSFARRAARGDSYFSRFLHMLVRCVVLIALGVFLNNPAGGNGPYTVFSFVNVLTQIGLGYWFVFLMVNRGVWVQGVAIALVLGGTWFAFFRHPLPPEGFDYASVGVKPEEQAVAVLPGMQGHWSKNTNFAADWDRTWLNQIPRTLPPKRTDGETDDAYAACVAEANEKAAFKFNPGGYTTLNFVPSIATMLLGLMIGELLRSVGRSSSKKIITMLVAGAGCLAVGLALHYAGVCPIVKRIWTPSWALASGGIVIWMLAAFYVVFDHWGWRRLSLPLAVVGVNSIVVYLMSQMLKPWTLSALKTHLAIPYAYVMQWLSTRTGRSFNSELFGGAANPYQPLYESLAVLAVFWLVCVWLWRQRITVRI